MINCRDVEKLLPAYLEEDLKPDEKESIEEHLSGCAHCRKTYADLQKTMTIIGNLSDVEPPPWFKQKIMARVREEAKQKQGIISRLFHPLSIKIPVSVMAAVFIAVIASYVYRTGEEEMKALAPQTALPSITAEKDQDAAPAESQQAFLLPGKKKTMPHREMKKAQISSETDPTDRQQVVETTKAVAPPPAPGAASDYAALGKKESFQDKSESRSKLAAPQRSAPSVYDGNIVREDGGSSEQSAKALIRKDAQLAASAKARQAEPLELPVLISVAVKDVSWAEQEVEKILNGYLAQKITKSKSGKSTTINAQIKAQDFKDLTKRLKIIGTTKGKEITETSDRYISLIIEISGND